MNGNDETHWIPLLDSFDSPQTLERTKYRACLNNRHPDAILTTLRSIASSPGFNAPFYFYRPGFPHLISAFFFFKKISIHVGAHQGGQGRKHIDHIRRGHRHDQRRAGKQPWSYCTIRDQKIHGGLGKRVCVLSLPSLHRSFLPFFPSFEILE